jgi:hypothetical protein
MNTRDAAEPPGTADLLDDFDFELLAGLRDVWETVDPMPSDLISRIQFAVELEDVDFEVMRVREQQELAAARGDETTRLITFDGESLTIMVNVRPNKDGTIRLDGWLTPPASHPIELRTSNGSVMTTSDEGGRFVVDGVPHGMTQLVVRPDSQRKTVSTPTISL